MLFEPVAIAILNYLVENISVALLKSTPEIIKVFEKLILEIGNA